MKVDGQPLGNFNKRISLRMALVVMAVSMVILTLSGIIIFTRKTIELRDELSQKPESIINLISENLSVPLFNYDRQNLLSICTAAFSDSTLQQLALQETGSPNMEMVLLRNKQGVVEETQDFTLSSMGLLFSKEIYLDTHYLGKLTVEISQNQYFDDVANSLREIIIQVLIQGIVLFISLYLILRFFFVRPISRLTQFSSKLAKGDFDQPLDITRRDELGFLAFTMNQMQGNIKDKIKELEEEIHTRKEAESALKRNEIDLRTTLDSIGEAVIATDNSGNINRMNPIAQKLTGWDIADAINQPLSRVFNLKKSGQIRLNASQERYNAAKITDQTILYSKDGREIPIAHSLSPIKSPHGSMIGSVVVFRDISEEKAIQDQLLQSQKLDAIGQLAGGVAHDFNNMLTGIMAATDLLSDLIPEDKEAKVYLASIIESAESAASLSSELLSFSRKQPQVNQRLDIHTIIDDTISILKNTLDRGIEIICDYRAETSMVIGERSRFQAIFMNLGINGAHAMGGKKGTLLFETDYFKAADDFCISSPLEIEPGEYIKIQVKDTGEGIAAENMSKIFDPFFTTKDETKGTGLGLAASYGTIKQYGGVIQVESQLGKGSCFTILFPLSKAGKQISYSLERM